MRSMKESAKRFFDACETGGGWDSCKEFCHAEATFSAQAGALEGVETLESYTDWMKGLLTPVPDGSYEVRSFAVDEDRNNAPQRSQHQTCMETTVYISKPGETGSKNQKYPPADGYQC